MEIRILGAEDVRACIDMPAAIDAMADAFAALAQGEAEVPLRTALATRHGVSLFMPARVGPDGEEAPHVGAKVVSVNPANTALGLPAIHAVVLVLDAPTGQPRALLDGTWLTALRTGAVGGLAARLMARPDAHVVALFGAGVQARSQLEAVRCVRPVDEVRIYTPGGASARRLAAELEGLAARVVGRPEEALAGAHIVIAATDSAEPVFPGSAVEPGTHVTAVGSYTPEMREVDATLVSRARVIVDQREAALTEAGDLIGPIRDGVVDASVIAAELGEVVLERAPGRTTPGEITLFKSVGNAVQDVVVAARVVQAAEARGRGTVVTL